MPIGRRRVLELSVVVTGAAVTGFASVLAACGSDDTGTTDAGTTNPKDSSTPTDSGGKTDSATDSGGATDAPAGVACKASITQNHGHTVTVPAADLDSSTPKTYSIKGSSDHDHQITLDATDFAQLKSKLSVAKTSTNGGQTHDHVVTILCT